MAQEDFYANDYERAGPRARPILRRSAYLARALQDLQQSSQEIKGGWGDLGARLLASALLEFQRGENDRSLEDAQAQDRANDPTALSFDAMFRPPPAAPPAPGLSTPPPASQMRAPAEKVADRLTLPQARGTDNAGEMDMMARLLMAEAPPQGQQAVAAVINNRAQRDNKSLTDVMTARHQFEPMGTQRGRERMAAIDPNTPQYGAAMEAGKRGQFDPDPTGGAGNFFSPAAQSALGRQPPQWAQGQQGQNIGGNHFFNLSNEAPLPPPPVLQRPPAQQTQQPPSVPSPSGAGAPPAAPVANQGAAGGVPQGPQARGRNAITPQQEQMIRQMMGSPDPRVAAEGRRLAQAAMQAATAPIQYEQVTINGRPFFYDKQNPGNLIPGPMPQEAMSQTQTAQQAGISAPPGTMFSRSPTNEVRQVYAPQPGQQVVSGNGQPYREAPIGGGTNDPTSGGNQIRNEGDLRQRFETAMQPVRDARLGYQKVLAAARDGTGASDIALIFGFMKTLDPTSTVREGEFATAQNSGSIDQSVANIYNRLLSGERLQPAQREQFANTARSQYEIYEQRGRDLEEQYNALARSYGLNPNNIVPAQPAQRRPAQPQPQQPTGRPAQGRQGGPQRGARRLY